MPTEEPTQCILRNQIEIMGAVSLLLRYVAPNLVGRAGELDRQRDDLLQRHKATQRALAPSKKAGVPEHCQTCGQTDGEYSHTARICTDPWHGDDHLRAKASTLPNGER